MLGAPVGRLQLRLLDIQTSPQSRPPLRVALPESSKGVGEYVAMTFAKPQTVPSETTNLVRR